MPDWLMRAAAAHPGRVALQRGEEVMTYAELLAAAAGARPAAAPGERVPLACADRMQFAVALHGCLLADAAAVPIDLRLGPAEQAPRRRGGTASTPGTLAVMHTSGTTSAPRPVELTQANFYANAAGSAIALGLDPRERWLAVMPLAHVGGLMILLRSAIYGTTVVVHDAFDTEQVLAVLMDRSAAITLVSLVPTMLARLLDAGLRSPPRLRWALLGGGPIAPGLLARAQSAGVPVAPTYGMTEACSQIATFGRPLHGVELRLSEAGEIEVRGPVVAPGALGENGWLATGDLGVLGVDGRLEITGRRADTIVSGGENVAPAEVEAVLLEYPGVAEVGVFARTDPEWGEAVCARVVLISGGSDPDRECGRADLSGRECGGADLGALEEAMRRYCRDRLAPFKVPKVIEFVSELPRTSTGKLLRRQLM